LLDEAIECLGCDPDYHLEDFRDLERRRDDLTHPFSEVIEGDIYDKDGERFMVLNIIDEKDGKYTFKNYVVHNPSSKPKSVHYSATWKDCDIRSATFIENVNLAALNKGAVT
jgi:hypothetical protein